MTVEGAKGHGERTVAVRPDDDPGGRRDRRWQSAGERARPWQLGRIERLVGQVPELSDLPVCELRARRSSDRSANDLPADLLAGVGERVGRVGEAPEERLR